VISGGRYILREVPLDICPIYVKTNSIVPNYPAINYVGEIEIDELTLDIYEGMTEYHHYQDNGEDFEYENGEYNEYVFSTNDKGKLSIQLVNHGYKKIYHSFKVIYKGQTRVVPFGSEKVEIDL
jgi:alpha-glucosidase